MGSRGDRTQSKVMAGGPDEMAAHRLGGPIFACRDEQLGSETDCATQGSNMGKGSFKISDCKTLWRLRQQEKLPVSQESLLERHTGS